MLAGSFCICVGLGMFGFTDGRANPFIHFLSGFLVGMGITIIVASRMIDSQTKNTPPKPTYPKYSRSR